MSERLALYRAIEAHPDEDAPRLVLADWLDENAASDCDRATAEFVRLGCALDAQKPRQTAKEGRWLDAHWRRLLPEFAGKFVRRRGRRSGRWVSVVAGLPTTWADKPTTFPVYLRLEFWRGFVRRCVCDSCFEIESVLPWLVAEQPFVCPETAFPSALADASGTTRIARFELGEAWWWLHPGTVGEYDMVRKGVVSIPDDPEGAKAHKLACAAFRAMAKSSAERAGVL